MSDSCHDRETLRVGYVLKQYPRLSETFILNEVLGLEESGIDVSIFSLRHATDGRFHPAIASVQGFVRYVANPDKAAFLDELRALPGLRSERLPDVLDFIDRLPPDRRARLVLQAIEIAKTAQLDGIDHLHAHFLTVAAHTTHLVHLLTGLPYSVTAHAKDIYRHTVDWDLATLIASHATALVTVCDANLQFLTRRLDGSSGCIVRIYNGLGPQDPPPPTATRNAGLVLGVGRLVEKKGFDLLLDAIASLAPEYPDIHCVLVGDGDQRTALETQAARLGIDHRVTFTGALPQDEVAAWLRRAQLLAAPCRIGTDGNQDALPTVGRCQILCWPHHRPRQQIRDDDRDADQDHPHAGQSTPCPPLTAPQLGIGNEHPDRRQLVGSRCDRRDHLDPSGRVVDVGRPRRERSFDPIRRLDLRSDGPSLGRQHRHPPIAARAGRANRRFDLRPRAVGHQGGNDSCRISPGRVDRAILGGATHEKAKRQHEGRGHQCRHREEHQNETEPHDGSMSLTPTPRTVCR